MRPALRAIACFAACAGLVLGVPATRAIAANAAAAQSANAPECPPFEAEPIPPAVALGEAGIAPSAVASQPAQFVTLPAAALEMRAGAGGEVLLALPKRADGSIPTDFQLAPGARIASSFFSPVLCSTLVRVVGAVTLDPASLISRAPAGSAVVRNDVYVTSATEVRPVGPTGPDPYRDLEYGLDLAQVDAGRGVTDGKGARIAVLDSAADANHRDLLGTRVVPIANGPATTPAAHGTMVAGIVHAIEHNAFGIEGIAPGAEVVSIPICTPASNGTSDECKLSDLLRGVDLAWENGAQVLNMALVGPPNPLLRRAMDRLDQLGVLLVAAVGNEGLDEPRYPAAYASVIGVGAVDAEGQLYPRSNRGPAVEVLAPGVEIVSTVPGDAFAFGDGTSLAAANVTGLLALAVAASGDPLAARTAFFQAAQEAGDAIPIRVPKMCDVFAKLGKPCVANP